MEKINKKEEMETSTDEWTKINDTSNSNTGLSTMDNEINSDFKFEQTSSNIVSAGSNQISKDIKTENTENIEHEQEITNINETETTQHEIMESKIITLEDDYYESTLPSEAEKKEIVNKILGKKKSFNIEKEIRDSKCNCNCIVL